MSIRAPDPGYSWLCRDRIERERFLDIDRRMVRTNLWLLLLLVGLLSPTIVEGNRVALLILALTLSFFLLVRSIYQRFSRPEVVFALALMVFEVGLVAMMVSDGVQHGAVMAILFWPAAGFNARYPPRVAAVGTAFVALLIIGAELGFGGSAVIDEPARLTAILGGLVAVTAITNVARKADVEARRASNHDPLTRMFNRTALENRVAEIEYQSNLSPEPVAVIVGDIDRFKAVNDLHGHAAGDVVLREVAYRIRSRLRAFDPAYRLGGEEFVMLLLGRGARDAFSVAEDLRAAVCASPIAGTAVTISFGVGSSLKGEPFRWEETFRSADRALYEAKRAGRNRVYADDRSAGAEAGADVEPLVLMG